MKAPNRIDVHQHVVPPFWAEELPEHGGDPSGWYSPDWTPQSAIGFMDSQQIAVGVLSLTAPSLLGWKGNARREMARRVNDYTAGLTASRADRLGNFATLPLPDVEGALSELQYAYDTLHVDGVVLLSNCEGHYLGDSLFEPLWAELNRREAVVLVHPGEPATISGIPGPIVDYPFDTTRVAVQLVLNGVLDRYLNVRIILAHAGGFVPYAAQRFADAAAAIRPGQTDAAAFFAAFQRFYFDTALSSGHSTLPSLTAFAGVGQILYGSDHPYAPAKVSSAFTSRLDSYSQMTDEDHDAINHGNAQKIFSRF